ncbi:MAG TPA: ABC transporter permease [Bryobacteraceae bacterium]|nr:ABC transporter permease [Bryobacteraceae bacterium]
MAIPLAYNLRNLTVRKTTTFMTALGIALTVAVLVAVLALVNGLSSAFEASGEPLNILVMRKGSNAELNGGMSRAVFQDLTALPGIARAADGHPLASLELITIVNIPSTEDENGANLTVRGLTTVGLELRPRVKLAEGRWFQAGKREVVVGKSVAKRHSNLGLGKKIRFAKGEWDIVGILDAGRGSENSEILLDLNQSASDYNRMDGLSSARLRATDSVAAEALMRSISEDRRFNSNAQTELDYMTSQTSNAAPIKIMGIFVAIIMAVGSSFAAMNTMYAAVARRAREVGTLRVLGFSRGSILTSFFLESLLLSAIGGALGCLLVLPLNNVTTGMMTFTTFSEIAFNFRVGPQAMAIGVGFAMIMGAIGGVFPARNAAKKEILVALRDQ